MTGEKNAFGTVGCFWHLKGGGADFNSCTGFVCFSSSSSFTRLAYIKHGIVCKIQMWLVYKRLQQQPSFTSKAEHLKCSWNFGFLNLNCDTACTRCHRLPFRDQSHVSEWKERNSMCPRARRKCIRWRTEWSCGRSGTWTAAVGTLIVAAIWIRFPIWTAKCTWWFQLAWSNLNEFNAIKRFFSGYHFMNARVFVHFSLIFLSVQSFILRTFSACK